MRNVWLIGKLCSAICTRTLPSKRQVMSFFLYQHFEQKKTIKESLATTVDVVLEIWRKSGIPTREKRNVSRMLKKLFMDWKNLKKSKYKCNKKSQYKTSAFGKSICNLFDINRTEKQPFTFASEDTYPGSVTAHIGNSQRKEKLPRKTENYSFKRSLEKEGKGSDAILFSSSTDNDTEISSGEEYKNRTVGSTKEPKHLRGTKNILNKNLASALDRCKVSDRHATLLLSSAVESLGQNPANYTISRSSIRNSRIKHRKVVAAEIKEQFKPNVPLTVHWDGKLLLDVSSKTVVDRLPVIVSGYDVEQLLGIPKLQNGTGHVVATAVVEIVKQWNLAQQIKCLCFDTTPSNTGHINGACVQIEKMLKIDLLHLACRHHVLEIVLEAVMNTCLNPSPSPEILLFKRFREKWRSIKKHLYKTGMDDPYTAVVISDIKESIISFAINQLNNITQPRDDYKELLHLTIIFLGGTPPDGVKFTSPIGIHRARWMAKAIYALKIWMFRDQFSLTAREENGILDVALFVVRLYVKAWYEAPLAICAPANDLLFLKDLDKYKSVSPKISTVAVQKFLGHLWYVSEELVALAFFDERVSLETKRKMVLSLKRKGSENVPKRASVKKTEIQIQQLEQCVSANTMMFFKILGIGFTFLKKDPSAWDNDPCYKESKKLVKAMKVVNDIAERGVSLMETYNQLHTRDENQKQYLLQTVSQHRKQFPKFNKRTLCNDSLL